MGIEIERKFLVDINKIKQLGQPIEIIQGYILNTPEKVVRVRVSNNKRTGKNISFITIKGKNVGISRLEFEFEIPYDDGIDMLNMLCDFCLSKNRYEITIDNKTWEIDIFQEQNEGLIIAEVELNDIDEVINIPDFVIKEVTNDAKYFNNNLILKPYNTWKNNEI